MRLVSRLALASLFFVSLQPANAETALELGAELCRKCAACHSITPGSHRTGPSLHNVVGRPAGHEDGYRYSKAMRAKAAEGYVWTEAELDAFLTKPQRYIRMTKMSFPGLKDEADRAAVIEYLKSHSE